MVPSLVKVYTRRLACVRVRVRATPVTHCGGIIHFFSKAAEFPTCSLLTTSQSSIILTLMMIQRKEESTWTFI